MDREGSSRGDRRSDRRRWSRLRDAAQLVPVLAASLLFHGFWSPAEARKVDVGGHRLWIECSGAGSPAVILDAGLGDGQTTWDWVQPGVAGFTRVCSYDRAGLGKSDPGPVPRTSAVIVRELATLLASSGIDPPYVLVGHSFAGLHVRLFAATLPEKVAGLVLVDATHEDYHDAVRHSRPGLLAKLGSTLALVSSAARNEFDSLEESVRQVRGSAISRDLPLVVITGTGMQDADGVGEIWLKLQEQLTALSQRSTLVVAAGSGHYVQFDRPELVVQAIRQVVEAVRRGAHASPGLTDSRRDPP